MSERRKFKYTHLWNDMPYEERNRLMPYSIETQILHLEQSKEAAVRGHQRHMREINDHIKSLNDGIRRWEIENGTFKSED